uniref:Uncharacterized protein n=1 Tax=Solanum lycopersicum TaxID=4081 RepID=A0A3Q7IG24_SOLLC
MTRVINDPIHQDVTVYQILGGRLLYLNITRPDISFKVQLLSQFFKLEAVMRLVRYIKISPSQGILFSSKTSLELEAFCSLSQYKKRMMMAQLLGQLIVDSRHGLADIFKLYSSYWSSDTMRFSHILEVQKAHTISRSSAEAEYRSMVSVVSEIIRMELNVIVRIPIRLHFDRKATMQLATNPIFHERSGLILPTYVNTKQQPADILTKGLGAASHHMLLAKLGVFNKKETNRSAIAWIRDILFWLLE